GSLEPGPLPRLYKARARPLALYMRSCRGNARSAVEIRDMNGWVRPRSAWARPRRRGPRRQIRSGGRTVGARGDRGWQHGVMSLKTFRIACAVVFVAGIVTMIVTSIVSNNMGVMVTTGVLTAIAALVLLAVTAATEGKPFGGITDDIAAERLERRIE